MGTFKGESAVVRDMGREEAGEEPSRDEGRPVGNSSPASETKTGADRTDTERPTPPPTFATADDEPDPRDGVGAALSWIRRSDSEWVSFLREILVSVLIVVVVGMLLYVISGVWPPLVAVESDSMDPHLQKGDLVLVMEEGRFSPDFAAGETGVVTAETGIEQDYDRFGGPGDVIVYQPDGSQSATPIIHRAHLYVETGENWYNRADSELLRADSCDELAACPAPTDGFITKGDNTVTNNYYDQTRGISSVVEPEWVRGTAVVRIPWLGWIRLAASDLDLPVVALTGTGGLAIG
ncbi:MAG: S26 family signal peptidase [Halodesulfurarchaeum sp.]|nr:S26 family signal peptidase [Halodesulfurarchaeum sp.]